MHYFLVLLWQIGLVGIVYTDVYTMYGCLETVLFAEMDLTF